MGDNRAERRALNPNPEPHRGIASHGPPSEYSENMRRFGAGRYPQLPKKGISQHRFPPMHLNSDPPNSHTSKGSKKSKTRPYMLDFPTLGVPQEYLANMANVVLILLKILLIFLHMGTHYA